MDKKVGHFRRYKLGELISIMEMSGFEVRGTRYIDILGVLVSIVYKFYGSKDGTIKPRSVSLYDRFTFPVSKLLDVLTGKLIGKNTYIITRKIEQPPP